MRTLFFGTPEFAVACLDALADVSEVVGVVCQPDKPVGRGLVLTPPPVKVRAEERGLPVVQPTKLKTGDFADWVRAQDAEVALVVAYGRILPPNVLSATRKGFVNVHASLLPRYRGAAPIHWAIVRGEHETGITLMLLDEGMDTGATLEKFATPIAEDETAGDLTRRLSRLGAEAVRLGLPRYVAGGYTPVAQDPTLATLAPMLEKKDGAILWSSEAHTIHNQVRGLHPWPGAFARLRDKTIKIHRTRVVPLSRAGAEAGEILIADKSRVVVACGSATEAIELLSVQLDGKKAMQATDWVLGRGAAEGDRFAPRTLDP
jgi:methionyl-tRNA formyltransferase